MSFPDDFLWGVSQSGFQFEMGDINGHNIDVNTDWYAWVHDLSILNRGFVSGDYPEHGIDYWHRYKNDHDNAQDLGLNAYRLGIEWSRIFPHSTFNIHVDCDRDAENMLDTIILDDNALSQLDQYADKSAVYQYREIINNLVSRDFKVFVCLNHFTLPLWIHHPIIVRDSKLKKGPRGWLDERTIIEFTKYAAYMAYQLGDIVDKWITINEPMIVAETGYLTDKTGFPPSIRNFNASRQVIINMIIAHARAYDVIKQWDTCRADYRNLPAEIGLIQNVTPVKPYNDQRNADVIAANFVNHTHNYLFINAINEGWLDTNLNGHKEKVEFKNALAKRIDYLGLNYYSRNVIKGRLAFIGRILRIPIIPDLVQGYGLSCEPNSWSKDGYPTSDFGWEIYPEGIVEVLKCMKNYHLPLYITEHGVADSEDQYRPKYIEKSLSILNDFIRADNIELKGYFHWSLNDNYEWAEGFKQKFGLFSVDLASKQRVPRKSASTFRKLISLYAGN